MFNVVKRLDAVNNEPDWGGGGGSQEERKRFSLIPVTGTRVVVLQQLGIVENENLRESDVPSRLCDNQKSICSMKG